MDNNKNIASDFCSKLFQNKITILNGATGTELMKYGYLGIKEEEWILEHKDVLREVQASYVSAGSEVIYTPTFCSNRAKLSLIGQGDKVEFFNKELTKISNESGAILFGNIGPTGLFCEPLGEAKEEELIEIYKEQVVALVEAGVDVIIAETMMTMEDCIASVKATQEVCSLPLFVCCTCNPQGRMITGTDVVDALKLLEPMGIDAFGLNCSAGPKEMLDQIKRLHKETTLPLIAKPNGGMPEIKDGKTVYNCGPEEFASYAKGFYDNGVRFLGGCCGTTPEHLRVLTEELKKLGLK